MNRSGFAGGWLVESRRQSYLLQLGIVSLFSFSWRHIADWLEKAAMVEPVDPFEDSESTASSERQGPRRRMTSVLNSPLTVSASALS